MRINEHTAISTTRLALVPYSAHHVPQYHEWMKDEEIQTLTASEPLSLDEEYAMQRSWRVDGDKLTFIVCCQKSPGSSGIEGDDVGGGGGSGGGGSGGGGSGREIVAHNPVRMVGDVNMFISLQDDGDDDDDDDGDANEDNIQSTIGELELMIAEREQRGKGLGKASVKAFLQYVMYHEAEILNEFSRWNRRDMENGDIDAGANGEDGHNVGENGIEQQRRFDFFAVKIGQDNGKSIALFEGIGFVKVGAEVSYFGEWELRCARDVVLDWVGGGSSSQDGIRARHQGEDDYHEVEYLYLPAQGV